jgi:deoxycytidine triphosphate deaminase
MLKHEGKAIVGDTIRAYDFKPCAGRDDAFIEGVVENANCNEPGFKCFKVTVTADKFQKYETKANKKNRIGQIVFVPFETSFMEFDYRVVNLSEVR